MYCQTLNTSAAPLDEDNALFLGSGPAQPSLSADKGFPGHPSCTDRLVCSIRWTGPALGRVTDARDGQSRVLRILTLSDRETVHNAIYDRSFRETTP